ncbi:hypothetical protein A2833_02000 [Candidatus Azambacteria bacterium RIFCSPHIGHO2_01_FULL_44_55]|nr:MAG: hypothetical protein A3A18_01115 [Candidatus Azambacteria bacterium RIFCSPLOWO2_01_FULL_44_84]OGD33461.1 MAG: hypothetical protein A3C78_00030 [Candidatus Azambacteria bacterium RIFCSPHIGHO2_02_FULL_45_18]OGD39688.1 MAG: hypothetical protein A2833_02000 [Candidatus Azambacteria bacterium RIFCSPHIGHO2_01_FULL_44_55]OGD49668.1 MAG: hypothetical protein A2608_02950 [Candidatus Azambacteria bacterium RIFOXYD1_FULL_44_10]
MIITIVIISILAISGIAALINKIPPFRICPICAGVAGTWFWLLIGIHLNLLKNENWKLITAILMGGSVVGIAYQIAKRLGPRKSEVLFKALFIPVGFIAVYGLLGSLWIIFVPAILFLAVLAALFIKSPAGTVKTNESVEEIKKRMEDCC